MQRRLLHAGDQELAVRAERDVEMRALPGEHLGRGLRVRETTASHRRNARWRAAGPSARRRARRRWRAGRSISTSPLALRTKACLPAAQATAPSGPSATRSIQRCFGVGGERLALAVRVGRHDLAVVAAGQDARAVARRPPGCRRHDRHALLARRPARRTAASPRRARRRRVPPRKWTPTTGAPAATGLMRSATEGDR